MALRIRYETIGQDLAYTQKSALVKGTDEGKVVAQDPATDDTVIVAAIETPFEGVVVTIDYDHGCSVSVRGLHRVAITGVVARGNMVELVGDGAGGVKAPAVPGTGKYYTVKNLADAGFAWILLG